MTGKKASAQLPLAEPAAVRDLRVLSVQIRNVLGLAERSLDADGRVDAGVFRMAPDASAETIGAQVAHAVSASVNR